MRAAACTGACLVALAASASGSAQRRDADPCIRPGETPVQLTTTDGAEVYGVELGTGSTGVVLGHQYLSDHCELIDFARRLAGAGYRALTIDFRGFGASSGGAAYRYDRDVAAAVVRLRTDGATRVELVGASMGGTAVLVAASSIAPPVDEVVSLSGPARYPRPRRAARRTPLARPRPVRGRKDGPAVCGRRGRADEGCRGEGQGDPAAPGRAARIVAARRSGRSVVRPTVPCALTARR
jgi:pimeloyl-ACP methyl ester carboxylesterase